MTVPNRVNRADILASIRKVWASPYAERSFRWRQKLLRNPQHVYPSVLLHRTVPSEKSGVMVLTDLETGANDALSVSVSEGVAAVVDGGAPETLIMQQDGRVRLLASSRTPTRKVIPEPPTQGVMLLPSLEQDPLLSPEEQQELWRLAEEVRKGAPREDDTPWELEFGFVKGKAYLMQMRPLQTSKAPATHPFLARLDATGTVTYKAQPVDLAAPLPLAPP
ncbi:MAG: PEP/pyruvate-binding domain-containing protein [Myxococcota bacterium]